MLRGKALDWLVLAGLVIAWGSAFAGVKVATTHFGPLWNTALRLLLSLPLLALVLAMMRERPPPLTDRAWRMFLLIGLVGLAAPFMLYAYSAQRLPSAVNAICNGASPIFTGLLGHALFAGERLTLRKGAGVLLGFLGLVVLVGPRLAEGASVETLALGAALFGAFLYAVANVLTRAAPPLPSTVGAFMMTAAGTLIAVAAAAIWEAPPAWPPLGPGLALLALAVFATALPTVGYVFLVRRRGPLFMSMSIYLAPLWATGLGVLALGERPGLPAYAALGLILLGVGLATSGGPQAEAKSGR